MVDGESKLQEFGRKRSFCVLELISHAKTLIDNNRTTPGRMNNVRMSKSSIDKIMKKDVCSKSHKIQKRFSLCHEDDQRRMVF